MINLTSINEDVVRNDIEKWLSDYIEVNNKFYDYKFPPCPFARQARLKGLVTIKAYHGQGITNFIQSNADSIVKDQEHHVCIMAFPAYFKWLYPIQWFVKKLNKTLVPQDFYAQYGLAVKTTSQYKFSNGKPYFIVIINKLSGILKAHEGLKRTDYYKYWDDFHYQDVVVRRQKEYENITKSGS